MIRAVTLVTSALLLTGAAVEAQRPAPRKLSPGLIAEIATLYNRAMIRYAGDAQVDAGTISEGIALIDGLLTVGGVVRGDVVVIRGNLELQPGGRVEGRVFVVAGSYTGPADAVAGGVHTFRNAFDYEIRDGVLVPLRPRGPAELAAGREFDFGRMDLVATARPGYNRVEGLPVLFGPRFTLGHSNPTIVEALVTYRTAAGFEVSSGDFGYSVRTEQFVAGTRALRVGARLYSEVAVIEAAGVSDRESSLAAFVLHRDYRDHYVREGAATYVRIEPRARELDLRLEYADERHTAVRPRRPWSLTANDQSWRPEPLVAEGRIRRVSVLLNYDTRNLPEDPADGWWVTARVERGLGGSLEHRLPGAMMPAPRTFLDGTLDLRRYARLGPSSRLAVRAVTTGALDDGALPVQRQHALGGEGSLPGFALHQFDCGGSTAVVRIDGVPFQQFYGCDRAALLQLEYQSDLRFMRPLRGSRVDQLGLFQRVRLVGFMDVGRAWTRERNRGIRSEGSDGFSADAGFGVRLGTIGLYWAVPVSGRGESMNFFVRVGPRF